MSLLGTVLLQTTHSSPAGSEPAPDWAFSLFMLVFVSFGCALLAIFALLLWAASTISGGTRRNRRSDRGGTWVAVPEDDLWIHFSEAEDAREQRHPGAHAAPRSRPGPYRADLWDEP